LGIDTLGVLHLDVKKSKQNSEASMMLKSMDMMASLPRASMAKACRRALNKGLRPWCRIAANFYKKLKNI
jgi:hypothetical protein